MSMLEYFKVVLEKVSFDPSLFRAELIKAISKLIADEISDLKKWCVERFGWQYCVQAYPEFAL